MPDESLLKRRDLDRIEERKTAFEHIRRELTLEKVREIKDEREFREFVAQGLHEDRLKFVLREEEIRSLEESFRRRSENEELAHRHLLEKADLLENLEKFRLVAERQRADDRSRMLEAIEGKRLAFDFQLKNEWKKYELSLRVREKQAAVNVQWLDAIGRFLEKAVRGVPDRLARATGLRDDLIPKMLDAAIPEPARLASGVAAVRSQILPASEILDVAASIDAPFAERLAAELVRIGLMTEERLRDIRGVLEKRRSRASRPAEIELLVQEGRIYRTGHDEVLRIRLTNFSEKDWTNLAIVPAHEESVHLETLRPANLSRLESRESASLMLGMFEPHLPGEKSLSLAVEFFMGPTRRTFRSRKTVPVRFEKFVDPMDLLSNSSIQAPVVFADFQKYLGDIVQKESWVPVDLDELDPKSLEESVREVESLAKQGRYPEAVGKLRPLQDVYADKGRLKEIEKTIEAGAASDAVRRAVLSNEWRKAYAAAAELTRADRRAFDFLPMIKRPGDLESYSGRAWLVGLKNCPDCGRPNNPELDKCHNCGHAFEVKYPVVKHLFWPEEFRPDEFPRVGIGRGVDSRVSYVLSGGDPKAWGAISRVHAEAEFGSICVKLTDLSSSGLFIGAGDAPLGRGNSAEITAGGLFKIGAYLDGGKTCYASYWRYDAESLDNVRLWPESSPLSSSSKRLEIVDRIGRGGAIVVFKTLIRFAGPKLDPSEGSTTVVLLFREDAYWFFNENGGSCGVTARGGREKIEVPPSVLCPLHAGDLIGWGSRTWKFTHFD